MSDFGRLKVEEALLHLKRAQDWLAIPAADRGQAESDLGQARAALECFLECGEGNCQREPRMAYSEVVAAAREATWGDAKRPPEGGLTC